MYFFRFNCLKFFIFFAITVTATEGFGIQSAEVITDGAMVYQEADFDSEVIGYLQKGQKVRISDDTTGAFFQVEFSESLTGYISDVDIKVLENIKRKEKKKKKKEKKPKEEFNEEEQQSFDDDSLLSDKSINLGPRFLMLNFKETHNNVIHSSNILTFGLGTQITTPKLNNVIFELTTHFTHIPPTFLKDLANNNNLTKHKGFLWFIEPSTSKKILEFANNRGILGGFGTSLILNLFNFERESETDSSLRDHANIRAGVFGFLNIEYNFGSIGVSIQPRYYFELNHYPAFMLGLNFDFNK